ncbi:MAG: histidine phosphatase family protein [Planctomycetota bacterium]|nr:histidine phosphatase family protein [Planctomycetota bacterium]
MPTAARNVYIARHGNRIDFVDKTWKASAARPRDPHLSPDGVEQARKLGRRLKGAGIRHLFCSPFYRCVETAFHVAEALDLPIRIEHGACEWLKPEWFPEMPDFLPPEVLARTFPRVDTGYRSLIRPEYPEHDERTQTWPRCAQTIRALLASCAGDLLVIGHGASFNGLAYGLLEGEPELHGGLTALAHLAQREAGWELLLAGCQAHLEDAEGELRFN